MKCSLVDGYQFILSALRRYLWFRQVENSGRLVIEFFHNYQNTKKTDLPTLLSYVEFVTVTEEFSGICYSNFLLVICM